MSAAYEITDGNLQARLRPLERGDPRFVASLEFIDANTLPPEALAHYAGRMTLALMQTHEYASEGGPYHALSVEGLPVFERPRDLVTFATGGGIEVADSKRYDYGQRPFSLAEEDPDGNVHPLNPSDVRHLPDMPGAWHTDLTYMPNRPPRTTLQAANMGTLLRPKSEENEVRSTIVADGRWLLKAFEERVAGTELEVKLDQLLTTTSFARSFGVDRYHILARPLTALATHPKVVVGPDGERALTLGTFTNCHYEDGTYLDEDVARRMDEVIEELLQSDEMPTYEHQYHQAGSISIISDRTPHRKGVAPFQDMELRRVTTHDRDLYVAQFSSDAELISPPPGHIRPEVINQFPRENYMMYLELAAQGAIGAVDVATVNTYFRARCSQFLKSMYRMIEVYPDEVDLEAECIAYAARSGIPGVGSVEDFIMFAGADGQK